MSNLRQLWPLANVCIFFLSLVFKDVLTIFLLKEIIYGLTCGVFTVVQYEDQKNEKKKHTKIVLLIQNVAIFVKFSWFLYILLKLKDSLKQNHIKNPLWYENPSPASKMHQTRAYLVNLFIKLPDCINIISFFPEFHLTFSARHINNTLDN